MNQNLLLKTLFLTLSLLLTFGGHWLIPTAQAQAGQVGCTNGVGDVGALMDLIQLANSNPGQDTLALGPNCLYLLDVRLDNSGNGLPVIRDDLVIEGNGATIRRVPDPDLINPLDRFYRLLAVGQGASLTLQDLTLQDGFSLTGNGGAISAGPGTALRLERVKFLQNTANFSGGGLYTEGAVVIDESEFRGNTAGSGGGLYSLAEVRLTGGRFEDNHALSGDGGGLFIQGSIILTGTKVVSNTAEEDGGGLSINGSNSRYGIE